MKDQSAKKIELLRQSITELTNTLDNLEEGHMDNFSSPLYICEDMVIVAKDLMDLED